MEVMDKLNRMYNSQITNSKSRGHTPPTYSRKEFINYCLKSKKFKTLFKNWVESGYVRKMMPSIDRINNNIGYSFDNIQITTLWENEIKGSADGILYINRVCKHTGNILSTHKCIRKAAIEFNIDQSNISKVLKGKQKTCGGFIWKYK